jgi:hypothetical protein
VLVPEEEADGKIASEWRSGSGSRSVGVGEVRTEDEALGVRCLGWSVGVLVAEGVQGSCSCDRGSCDSSVSASVVVRTCEEFGFRCGGVGK